MNRILATVAVLAAATTAAQADMIDARFTGTQKGTNVRVTSPTLNGNTFAGQLKFTLSDGPAAWNGQWITFCTELPQHTNGSVRPYELVELSLVPGTSPMGADKADAILDMCLFANGAQALTTTSNDLATAFQLAVWEIVHDYNPSLPGFNLDITAGAFSATRTNSNAFGAPLMTELNNLFGAVGNMDRTGMEVVGLRSGQYQDQLIPNAVPAPGAAALAGLGSLLVASRRRR